jgi:hypothetical protein
VVGVKVLILSEVEQKPWDFFFIFVIFCAAKDWKAFPSCFKLLLLHIFKMVSFSASYCQCTCECNKNLDCIIFLKWGPPYLNYDWLPFHVVAHLIGSVHCQNWFRKLSNIRFFLLHSPIFSSLSSQAEL